MNSLPAQNSTSISRPIEPIDRRLSDAVASILNGVEMVAGQAVARRLPTPELRGAIDVRLADVRRALAPLSRALAEKERAARAIADMLTGWINAKVADPRAKVAGYVAILADLPCWAVEQVCRDAGTGRIEGLDPAYPPSAAQLHVLCEELLARLRKEAADLITAGTVKLVAHVPSEEERLRIGVKLVDLGAELKRSERGDEIEGLRVKAERNAGAMAEQQARVAAEYAAAGLAPPKDLRFSLSLTARKEMAEREAERNHSLPLDQPAYQEAGE